MYNKIIHNHESLCKIINVFSVFVIFHVSTKIWTIAQLSSTGTAGMSLSPVWSPLWSCNFAASSNFPPQVSHRKCRSPASLFWWRRRSLNKKCLLALVAFESFVRIYCVSSHVPCVIPCAKKHKITFFTWIFFFELVPPKMSQWWVRC